MAMSATVYSSLYSLAGTATVEAANWFIAETCLPDRNRRFEIRPSSGIAPSLPSPDTGAEASLSQPEPGRPRDPLQRDWLAP